MTGKTIRIRLRLGEPYWRQVGRRDLDIELESGAHVADLLQAVEGRYPDLLGGELPPTVFLNDDLATPEAALNDEARVVLVWAAAGG